MIEKALFALLSANPALTDLIGERIYAVAYEQGGEKPAIAFNTDGLVRLGCRRPGNTRQGVLEIAVFSDTIENLSLIVSALHEQLDGQQLQDIASGYVLTFGNGVDTADQPDEDIDAFYKRIEFPLTATKRT